MNEQRNNGRGIFYGVIGVATLVVAIVGATFAYFTATAYTTENNITGNMATVSLSLAVSKVTTVDEAGGMIPMSSGMVEKAVNNGTNDVCKDDNGNAVCQVYAITVTNTSSAAQYVDGYVALKGGSGTASDVAAADWKNLVESGTAANTAETSDVIPTMRWAQVFQGDGTTKTNSAATGDYSTAGVMTLGADTEPSWSHIGEGGSVANTGGDSAGKNTGNIVLTGASGAGFGLVTGEATIYGSTQDVINKNYIRISDHAWQAADSAEPEDYNRTDDITSALVFSQYLAANNGTKTYYIVVWLAETGSNQTQAKQETTPDGLYNPDQYDFFSGNVTFLSGEGSEVSASFASHVRATATP